MSHITAVRCERHTGHNLHARAHTHTLISMLQYLRRVQTFDGEKLKCTENCDHIRKTTFCRSTIVFMKSILICSVHRHIKILMAIGNSNALKNPLLTFHNCNLQIYMSCTTELLLLLVASNDFAILQLIN